MKELKKYLIRFLKWCLGKLGEPVGRVQCTAYPLLETQLQKMQFERRYDYRTGQDSTYILEDLKREVLRLLAENFYYYFPVTHYTNEMTRCEEYRVTMYYPKNVKQCQM